MIARGSRQPPDPVATFLVEREPGTGYVVTACEGPRANKLRKSAILALDYVGQPDPNGPHRTFHWLGPVGPAGEAVGIDVQLTESGEARYQQTWFATDTGRVRRLPFLLSGICGVVLGLSVMGILRGFAENPVSPSTAPRAVAVSQEPRSRDGLSNVLDETRPLRAKLREFLSQDGLAETAGQTSSDAFVLLVAVRENPSTEKAIVRWRPSDNARMIELLQALDNLDEKHDNPK